MVKIAHKCLLIRHKKERNKGRHENTVDLQSAAQDAWCFWGKENQLAKSTEDMNHPTQGSSKINVQIPSSLSELRIRTRQPPAAKSNETECGKEENEHVASHYMKLAADVREALHEAPASMCCSVLLLHTID